MLIRKNAGSNLEMFRAVAGISALSAAFGLFVFFMLPTRYSYGMGFMMLALSFLFITGLCCYVIGQAALMWRRRKSRF